MSYRDVYIAERSMERHAEEAARHSEFRRMLREANIERRGWLSRQGCWLLCQIGRLLVAVGHRLEQSGMPQPLPVEG
jgi:hypothetical protein